MTLLGFAALTALLAIFLVVGSQLAGPYFGYRIAGFRVWKSSLDDISDIQTISFAGLWATPSLRLMNRPFARYVLVRKRSGICRAVVITPDNAEEFVKVVEQRIRHAE
jgi:hypothetical protein